MRVGVVIPAYNEAEALPRVLADLVATRPDAVLVVDNGSTDATATAAVAGGAAVVTEPRRGYGRACLSGVAALGSDVDAIVFMDADAADDVRDLPALLEPVRAGRADLTIGSRTLGRAERGSLTVPQQWGNRLACALIRWWFGHRYTDLGPFRVIRRTALERLGMTDQGFGWTVEMQVKALLRGLRIVEVPVHYRRRVGTSKISGTVRGTWRAGTAIVGTIWRLKWGRMGWER